MKPTRNAQLIFVLLQFADVVTTMLAIHMGGAEQNIIVSHFMAVGTLQGLIFSKLLVLSIAVAAIMARKGRAVHWANLVFTGVVLWNVSIILRLASQAHQG